MAQATTAARLENWFDLLEAHRGLSTPDRVRSISVSDARGDTEFTGLSAPSWMIEKLGLQPSSSWRTEKSEGGLRGYGGVRLSVRDRECSFAVDEGCEHEPIRIGRSAILARVLVV